MQRESTAATPRIAVPTISDMQRVWRADRCVQASSAGVYVQWIRRFRAHCAERQLDERAELTLDGARRFIAAYARRRHLDPRRIGGARSAVYALSRVYQVMELSPPAWRDAPRVRPVLSALLQAYADHLARRRGNPAATLHIELEHLGKLLKHLAGIGKTWRTMTLPDIDEFLISCSHRYARSTTAGIASSVRSFTRFLLVTGRIRVGFAEAVISPVRPKHERPRRALPWEDVQRLLRAVDTSTARGLRDHALLLMMSTYGFGVPVDVLQLQPDHFAGAEAVGAHHQQQRVVAQTAGRRGVHSP